MENAQQPVKPVRRRRRRVVLLAVVVAVVAAGALAYVFVYLPWQHQQAVKNSVASNASKTDQRSDVVKQATQVAYLQVGSGDPSGAVATLDGAIGQSAGQKNNLVALYSAKGSILQGAGKTADAVTAYKAAIAEDPQNYVSYEGLGLVYQISGDKTDALAAYQRALTLAKDPNNPTEHGLINPVTNAQVYITRLETNHD